jgi:uncharacterized protein (DUF2252 family)
LSFVIMSPRSPSANKVAAHDGALVTLSPSDRYKAGVRLRKTAPRSAQAEWNPPSDRADPVAILIAQGKTRVRRLLPVRYERMRADPFAFLRGAAAIMAADLAHTPATGYRLQSCGDAHLGNFGAYASSGGPPVFDVNDFDETLPAPFEWDLKRLATSLVVAGRVAQYSAKSSRALARIASQSYREHMANLAVQPPIEAWTERIDLTQAVAEIEESKLRGAVEKQLARRLALSAKQFGLVRGKGEEARLRDKAPLVYHLDSHALPARKALSSYAKTLEEDCRVLLKRYSLRDVAFKAVGVGSVGTFCAIGLMTAGDGSPLLLQIKEAQESVLEPFAGASAYPNSGRRVVVGQRMMQATSDSFLGWTRSPINGRHFYIRRLKDSRLADIGAQLETALPFYASLCGRTLARAHARSGDPVLISGYVGAGTALDEAISDFAVAYADQTETDWKSLKAAITSGRIAAAGA